ncbi:hypothetical protein SynPROS71_02912 [Synechococcus sp. PROS-7-1]|nr:hypothetical protein SynPROS71_02912 [Synechococcus sp. PROS-7-1]
MCSVLLVFRYLKPFALRFDSREIRFSKGLSPDLKDPLLHFLRLFSSLLLVGSFIH